MSKNHEACLKTEKKKVKKYLKIIKNVEKHKEKPSKLSKNHQKCRKTAIEQRKITKNRQKL